MLCLESMILCIASDGQNPLAPHRCNRIKNKALGGKLVQFSPGALSMPLHAFDPQVLLYDCESGGLFFFHPHPNTGSRVWLSGSSCSGLDPLSYNKNIELWAESN